MLSMEETMGKNALNAVLNLADLGHWVNNYPPSNFDKRVSFNEISALHQGLEEMYGPRGGRGVALRTGMAAFKYGLQEFGGALDAGDLAFKLLPLNMKLREGAHRLAEAFNKFTDQKVMLTDEPHHFLWKVEGCAACWGRRSETPCCHMAVGLVQESFYWVSGGNNFEVTEVSCIACGDKTCTIQAEKEPNI